MIDTEVRLIIFFEAKDGEALYTQQKQVWEMTVDHELLMAKFRLKLKKVGKSFQRGSGEGNKWEEGYMQRQYSQLCHLKIGPQWFKQ